MASRVKRAATSDMRVAPLVITTNCTMTRMTKMIAPTTAFEPATKLANAWMTWPAAVLACSGSLVSIERMSRVDATLSTRRNSVVPSSSAGKTLKSSGLRM